MSLPGEDPFSKALKADLGKLGHATSEAVNGVLNTTRAAGGEEGVTTWQQEVRRKLWSPAKGRGV